MIVDNIRYTN